MAKYNIVSARLDIYAQDWYKKEIDMDELPYITYYKKGDLLTFPSIRDPPRMARVVEKYNKYWEQLATVEQAENFVLKDHTYDWTGRLLTRPKVLAVIWDRDEYSDQLSTFKQIAEDFIWREDISFAVVTDKEVAKTLKLQNPGWFGQNFDNNTILVYLKNARYLPESVESYDLLNQAGDYESIHDFIGMASLAPVEELTHLNRNAFHGQVPKLYLFYSPVDLAKSDPAVENFKLLAAKIGRKYNFVLSDGRDNLRKMVSVGINGCKLPCIGFESAQSDRTVFKYDNELLGQSIQNMTRFLGKYQNGEIFDSRPEVDGLWDSINQHEKITENMTLTYAGLRGEVFKEGAGASDYLLYFYNGTQSQNLPNLRTFSYVEHFLQFRLHLDGMQAFTYDFG
jgi:hypothetical protein